VATTAGQRHAIVITSSFCFFRTTESFSLNWTRVWQEEMKPKIKYIQKKIKEENTSYIIYFKNGHK
jgi:hypothetical protein